jgi:hypothetical protein
MKPKDPNFHLVHPMIKNNRRAFPHLKDCIVQLMGPILGLLFPRMIKLDTLEELAGHYECYGTLICISLMLQLDNLGLRITSVLSCNR